MQRKTLKQTVLAYLTSFGALEKPEKLGIIIILDLALLSPLVESSGWDFLVAFRDATLTGEYGVNTWNPYPLYWLLYPFFLLPARVAFVFWNLIEAICFIVAIKKFNGRFLPFALSLPTFWLFYIGQLEGLMALGLVLITAVSSWVIGIGVMLLSLKPQIGLFPILFILLKRRDWRILVVPGVIYGLSFLYWGFWIPEWIASILNNDTPQHLTNISLWPYSLILLPILLWQRDNIKVWLTVQSLVVPYFAVYSLAPLFTMWFPTWANAMLWLLYLSAIFVVYAVPGYLVPLALLAVMLFALIKKKGDHVELGRGVGVE
ncbi:MAG: hypothetical protein GY943_05485 [Chloroflexi bacterium]|nr:hypothetical protein [Chloroflexota bacterium]